SRVIFAHGPGQRVKMMSATHTCPRRLVCETASLFWFVRLNAGICAMTGIGRSGSRVFEHTNAPTIAAMVSASPVPTRISIFLPELLPAIRSSRPFQNKKADGVHSRLPDEKLPNRGGYSKLPPPPPAFALVASHFS